MSVEGYYQGMHGTYDAMKIPRHTFQDVEARILGDEWILISSHPVVNTSIDSLYYMFFKPNKYGG